MTRQKKECRSRIQPLQGRADLQQERAALDKASRGARLVVEAMDEAPDEYRRAFAFCLALSLLAEAARTPQARVMLQAASGPDMRAAPVPDFIQLVRTKGGHGLDRTAPEMKGGT